MPEAKRPLKVFLCHAHADREPVRALYARLKREGVDVWLDKEKLLPGADWEFEIRKAVRESDVVVVCLSAQFNQAGFRQKEVRIALDTAMEKSEGEVFIIPARLEECDSLESLSKWHWVDLFERNGFQQLMRALRIRAEKIGAELRQLKSGGTTALRPKIKIEQMDTNEGPREKTEQDVIEKARLEAEELEKQKSAKEQADREAAAKAARDKAEQDAIEKAQSEADELEGQKTANKKTEWETAEKVIREKAEQDSYGENRIRNGSRGNKKIFPTKNTRMFLTLFLLSSITLFFVCIFLAWTLKIVSPSVSSIKTSPMINNLSVTTSEYPRYQTSVFNQSQDIYLSFNVDSDLPAGTQFDTRWYYQGGMTGVDLYILFNVITYTTDNNDIYVYFDLQNTGWTGSYRVDLYMNQNFVGTQYFSVK